MESIVTVNPDDFAVEQFIIQRQGCVMEYVIIDHRDFNDRMIGEAYLLSRLRILLDFDDPTVLTTIKREKVF